MLTRQGRFTFAAIVTATSLGIAAGCATMLVSSYGADPAELQRYRTYTWGPSDSGSTGDPRLDNNRFFDERVRARVEDELARRGFEKTATPNGDLLVHYHASVSQHIDVGELDGMQSCATGDCRPSIFDKGTLVVDLVQPSNGALIWRGWAESSFEGVVEDQAWMESRIDEAVARILARLPRRF
jgi:hypothetical protein